MNRLHFPGEFCSLFSHAGRVLLLLSTALLSHVEAGYTDPALSLSVLSSPSNANQPIVVFQGPTATAVQIVATPSNFSPNSYSWSQVADRLNSYTTSGTATFSSSITTAPQVTVTLPAIGIYEFQVTATDGTNTVTRNTWVNVWDSNPALNPNGTVGANPGINPPTSVRLLSPDPGPYCHPRILFSRADWSALSNKTISGNAAYSSEAAAAVTKLTSDLTNYFDNSSTSMGQLAADMYAYGQGGYSSSYYTNTLLPAYTASGAPTGDLLIGIHPTSSLYDALASACYLAWIGTDPTLDHSTVPTAQQSRFTYLATVVAAAAKFEYTYNSATVPNPNPHFNLALCYDLVYDWMTTQQQTDTRNYLYSIGNGVYNTGGGGTGSSLATVPPGNQQNGQDFPNLADGIILADMAIEGEQSSVPTSVQNTYYPFAAYATGPSAWPYADPASVSNLHRQIRANTEWNVTPWGFLMNMVDYFQLGQNTSMPGSLALARRGENQFVTANFYQSSLATIYNSCNREDGAGMDLFDHHDGGALGDGPGGEGAAYIVKYMYPDDPMVDYFYRIFKRDGNENDLCQAIFGVPLQTSNLSTVASAKGLALTKFDPLRAVAISRNGWNENDLNLIYEDRWDNDGHMHAERNNFSLYALGRAWSCPPGYHCTINDVQATVLIQSSNSTLLADPATQGYIGQSPSSATDATTQAGNFPTPPGKILQITEEPNKLWTLFAGDASAAYNYGYISGSSTNIDTGQQNAYFTYPGLVGALLNADMSSYLTGDLQVNQTGYNPVEYAIRSIITVRGTNPYVLVIDDINKDGTAHNYRWDMPCAISFGSSGGRFVNAGNSSVYSSLAIQSGATATDGILYHAPVDTGTTGQTGLPRLLVRDVSTQSTSGQPAMFIDDRPSGYSGGNLTYGYDNNQKVNVTIPSRRLLIERDNVVSPQYKVLLYPYTSGSTTPLTSWDATNTILTVNQQNGTTDTLTFASTNADHRTRLVAFARSTGTGAPTLNLPANVIVAASGTSSSGVPTGVATFTLTATAANGSSLTPIASLPSGSSFPIGTTTVVASAIDSLGQETTGTFTVTVTPPPPQLSVTGISNLGTSGYGITLSWPYFPGVTGYNVKRAAVSGGPYTTISANQSPSNTTYTDSGLTSTSYFYVVTALLNSYESGNSNEVALAPAISPFTAQTLGLTSGSGAYQTGSGSASSYFLSCFQGNIGGFSESGSILLTPWTGDGTFTAHLANVNQSGTFANYGVMFRDSTNSNAAESFIGYAPYTTINADFINRASDGSLATETKLQNVTAPSWYRLVRSGSNYTGYYSADGVNWTVVGTPVTQSLPTTGYAGLAIGAGNNVQIAATFDNVVFLCTPTATAGNANVALAWTESFGAASYSVQRSTSATGPFTTVASGLSATNYTDMTVTNLTTYYYTVTAVSASGSATVSPVVSVDPAVLSPPSTSILPVNTQNILTWTPVTGAAFYSVLRGTTTGGPYQTLQSGITTTTYTDTGLTDGTPYFYVVIASTANGNQSPPSAEVSGVPVLWTDLDIGSTAPAGKFLVTNGTLQVEGAGADIQNSSDDFNFLYRPWTGDGVWIAHVTAIANTNAWAKAGVMFRASTAATSQNEAMLESYSNGVTFQSRTTANSSTTSSGASGSAPQWVKLDRVGNSFTASQSIDGLTWTTVGSAVSNTITGAGVAGLAVTSHNNGTLCTATFDKTAFLVSPTALTSSGVLAYSVNLGWTTNPNSDSSDATATQVEYSPTGANNWSILSSTLPATATTYTASGLALGTAYDFRVKTILGALSSDYATLADVTTSTVVPPSAPTSLSETSVSSTSINLSWADQGANANAYTVEQSLSGANSWIVLTSTLSPTTTTYLVTNLTPGTTYDFRVFATNAGGASNFVSLTTTAGTIVSSDTPTMPTWALLAMATLLVLLSRNNIPRTFSRAAQM